MMRAPIAPKLRFSILRRDNFTCQYCGARAPHAQLQVDHIHPVAKGGTNERSNLITSCWACNIGKGTDSDHDCLSVEITALAQKVCDAVRREFPKEFRPLVVFPLVRRHLEMQSHDPIGAAKDIIERIGEAQGDYQYFVDVQGECIQCLTLMRDDWAEGRLN